MQKIMFNDRYGLTKAVLDGRKTMTRREESFLSKLTYTYGQQGMGTRIEVLPCGEVRHYRKDSDSFIVIGKSRFQVGEVVAVAQSYETVLEKMIKSKGGYGEEENEFYGIHKDTPGWKNKMFVKSELMPKKIKITDIKVERLQDISERDCIKEGVIEGRFRDFPNDMFYPYKDCKDHDVSWTAKGAFSKLIDKVSGKGTWERNPWVFAYTFELVK